MTLASKVQFDMKKSVHGAESMVPRQPPFRSHQAVGLRGDEPVWPSLVHAAEQYFVHPDSFLALPALEIHNCGELLCV